MVELKCPTEACRFSDKRETFDNAVDLATHIIKVHPGYNIHIAYTDLLYKIYKRIEHLEREQEIRASQPVMDHGQGLSIWRSKEELYMLLSDVHASDLNKA